MCGRFLIADDDTGDLMEINRIVQELNAKYYGDVPMLKTGEIFPTDDVPVLIKGAEGVFPEVMKWGFPKWKGSGVIINARSESAHEKKVLFAEPLMRRRCVIASSGYFEWRAEETGVGKKTKFLFRLPGESALYMAGLYTDGRFVILTTAANEYVRDVHHRMPVVLRKNEIMGWLGDSSYISKAFNRGDIALEKQAV